MTDEEQGLKLEAIVAGARGDWDAERKALDASALIEPEITCDGYGPVPSDDDEEVK
jgi:hypothetical protein